MNKEQEKSLAKGFRIANITPSDNDMLHVTLDFKPAIGGQIKLDFILPPLAISSISIDTLEERGIQWMLDKEIIKGDSIEKLKRVFVAGVTAVFYAALEIEDLPCADKYIKLLYMVDDWIDDCNSTQVGSNSVRHFKDRLIEVLTAIAKGKSLSETFTQEDSQLMRAFGEVFEEANRIFIQKGTTSEEFLDSINDYLTSTFTEKAYEEKNRKPNEHIFASVRDEAGAVPNCIAIGASLMGIPIKPLHKRYSDLKFMHLCAVRCVWYSNDVLSHAKELKSSIKKNDGEPRSSSELIDLIIFNIVQVKWQQLSSGNPEEELKEALISSVKEHNQLMEDYYFHKKNLLEYMSKELEATKDAEETLRNIEKAQRDVLTYCKILEGFLAHPWWEFVAPRYNLALNESNEVLLRNLISEFLN